MQPGTQLGHYEIVSALGRGGMGEVWRARDQKLGREVAIKTLPEEFAKDEERLARFEREAKLLASLNHPNIATIHGLEEDSGIRFLVLELVEGDTLAERLQRGAIQVEESLKLALQIAEALEAAHASGVVHRDLKPANIKVTPDGKIKVLDFGLAKAFAGDGTDVNLSQSPTLSMAATQRGVILGTAAYMSPEQASGDTTDKRADIWSFGVVLFEMLTGRQTFDGKTVSHVLADVLRAEPEWNSLPPNLHPRLRLLLERCLEKESKDRYGDISDARVDIQRVLADPDGVIVQPVAEVGQTAPKPMLRWIAVTAVISVIVAGVAVWYLKPEPPRSIVRFDYELPEGQTFRGGGRAVVALSPDGSQFVYNTSTGLQLRSMDGLEARLISGTEENLTNPFFSPDGQWVGYWSVTDAQLKKIPISGGAPVILCDAGNPFGASWGEDNVIVYGQLEGIMSVSANGGTPELLVRTEQGEQVDSPQILPDGKSVIFTLASSTGPTRWGEAQIVVQSLASDERTILPLTGSDARYVPTGHIVYMVEDVLFAVPFDLANLAVSGGPVSIAQGLARPSQATGVGHFSFSANGSLVQVFGQGNTTPPLRLSWVDREGNAIPATEEIRDYRYPKISPDGTKVSLEIRDSDGVPGVWLYEIGTGTLSQLTFGSDINEAPIWTPDGRTITFRSNRSEPIAIFSKAADGSGVVELLLAQDTLLVPTSWSSDNLLAFYTITDDDRDLWVMKDREPEVFLATEANEAGPVFSPNGRHIAYVSDESGQREVYVRPYPSTGGGQRRLSTDGGTGPVWSHDGKELFYRRGTTMMSVPVQTDSTFTYQTATELFEFQNTLGSVWVSRYDVHPDGDRFLMVGLREGVIPREINVVLNWFEELKERVPVP